MKIDRKQAEGIAIIAIVIVVIIFSSKILSGLLKKFGFTKSPEQAAYDKMIENGVISVVNQSQKDIQTQFQNQKPTKSDAEWLNIAQTIKEDLQIKNEQDTEDAGYQLCRVQNDSDVLKLIQAFGEKSVYFFGIPYNTLDLGGFVHKYLSTSKISAINQNYASKNIKFRW